SYPQLRKKYLRWGLWARRSAYLDRYRFEIPRPAGHQNQWRSSICDQGKSRMSEMREDPRFPGALIHVSSFVDDGAVVGRGTKIWHFCHILSRTAIGTNCSIGQNVMIGPNVRVGNGCKIQNN